MVDTGYRGQYRVVMWVCPPPKSLLWFSYEQLHGRYHYGYGQPDVKLGNLRSLMNRPWDRPEQSRVSGAQRHIHCPVTHEPFLTHVELCYSVSTIVFRHKHRSPILNHQQPKLIHIYHESVMVIVVNQPSMLNPQSPTSQRSVSTGYRFGNLTWQWIIIETWLLTYL